MELHERVRYLRKEILKQSQAEFAAALGTSRDVINNIEGNRLKCPEQKEPLMKLMCEKFDINESWLLTGDGDPKREFTVEEELSEIFANVLNGDPSTKSRPIRAFARRPEEAYPLIEQIIIKMAAELEDKNTE